MKNRITPPYRSTYCLHMYHITHTKSKSDTRKNESEKEKKIAPPPLSTSAGLFFWIYRQLIRMSYYIRSAGPNISQYIGSARLT